MVAVSVHVGDRTQRHTAFGGGLGHGRGNHHHQARVKRLGNQVFRAEGQRLTHIRRCHHFALLGLRQLGDGVHAGNLHLLGDRRRTDVERTAEDEREAQHVVDLVRIIRTARGHDGVAANGRDLLRRDFRVGIGHGENDRPRRHGTDHVGAERALLR